MDILVVGGHGQIALRLLKILATQGHQARGLIRKRDQAADLEAVGAVPVLGDLENDPSLEPYVKGADAVVFAAGAGPGSGPARKHADDYLRASGLDYTIVRPGSLTNDPGTGLVRVSTELGNRGPIPRDDVAAVLAATLTAAPATIGVTFELFGGDTPIAEALGALAGQAA